MKRITCIVNVYNEEKNIEGFLCTLLDQKRIPDKVIIVDDGSTDNSIKIVKKFEKRINLTILQTSHQGFNKGRKFAFGHCKKDDLIFCADADLFLLPTCIEELEKEFDDNTAVVGSNILSMGDKRINHSQDILNAFFIKKRMINKKEITWTRGGCIMYSGIVKDWPFDVNASDDVQLCHQARKKGYKVKFNHKSICYHADPKNLKELWAREKNIGRRTKATFKITKGWLNYNFLGRIAVTLSFPISFFYMWYLIKDRHATLLFYWMNLAWLRGII